MSASCSRSASRTRPRRWRCASAWRCTDGQAVDVPARARRGTEVHEAVAISTCNRTELYLVADDAVAAESAALGALARPGGIRPTELAGSALLAAQLRRRAPAVPRHLRAWSR